MFETSTTRVSWWSEVALAEDCWPLVAPGQPQGNQTLRGHEGSWGSHFWWLVPGNFGWPNGVGPSAWAQPWHSPMPGASQFPPGSGGLTWVEASAHPLLVPWQPGSSHPFMIYWLRSVSRHRSSSSTRGESFPRPGASRLWLNSSEGFLGLLSLQPQQYSVP